MNMNDVMSAARNKAQELRGQLKRAISQGSGMTANHLIHEISRLEKAITRETRWSRYQKHESFVR